MKLPFWLLLFLFLSAPMLLEAQHPLDALSAEEIMAVTALLKNSGHVDSNALPLVSPGTP